MESVSANPRNISTVTCGDTRVTIVGTAHVSRASAEQVRDLIADGDFDAVALELCDARRKAFDGRDDLENLDLFQVIRQGKAGLVAANLALGAYQQRVASQLGVEPGAEMRAGLEAAAARDIPVLLVDRDIGVTLRRLIRRVPWNQRLTLFAELIGSLFTRESLKSDEVERLKESDMLRAAFSQFAERAPSVYETLIEERDRYMAARLRESACSRYREVLLVVGAGHAAGVAAELAAPREADPLAERQTLEAVPPPSPWLRRFSWTVVGLILLLFALGFSRDTELGLELIWDWVLINGSLAAVGAALALGHPLSIVGSFMAAPLTSLNPAIGAGAVAAALELGLRRPRVKHFRALRADLANIGGWWRNRVARTLLVFVFVSLGSALGTYLAGFRMVGRWAAGG